MATEFTPLIYLALAVALIIVLSATFWLLRRLDRRSTHRRELKVIEFSGDVETIKKVFKEFAPRLALEIAVHQIGADVHSYLVVPVQYVSRILKVSGGKEVSDYNIYHPGGTHLGYSLKIEENSSASLEVSLDMLKMLDFSKVDAIGEGAMFQLILGKSPTGKLFISSVRILVSAATKGEAEEIIESLKKQFSGCNWIEEKDQSFIDAATYRELIPNSTAEWRVS